MYKVSIPYKDYFNNNEPATEELYFNINAFELAEIMVDFVDEGGLGEYMRRAIAANENSKAFAVLKLLFIHGYGRRIQRDGRWRFIKNPAWIEEILPSPEFEAFYLKLAEDTVFSTSFWNGLVSEELLARALKIQEEGDVLPAVAKEGGEKTKKFRDLSLQEQVAAMRAKAAANGLELED